VRANVTRMKALQDCKLYTFVDIAFLKDRDPARIAAELCEGGSDIIQLRAKNEPVSAVLRLAERILPITTSARVPLVINDHMDVALKTGAPVLHLGQEDFFHAGRGHRSELLPTKSPKLGLSTHSPDQAGRAISAGADYIAVGPVFATGTKPGRLPVTLDYVRWSASNVTTPWFAIGGINLDTIDDVVAAGARRVCVVSAILNSSNIVQCCREFRARLP
jgi:thiamine-phosphate pyrophosphorylase